MIKRIVVWGTGFVGKMVIPEIVEHPLFELVGVGVSNPDKVGRDVDEICGLDHPVGVTATDDVDAGGSSCFTTGIDPGFANDLFPMTLMGLCSDYTNYEGDY